MSATLTTVLRSPALARVRATARTWAQDHVDRPVASALKAIAQLRSGRTDVLYFGESTMIHIAGDDTDRRRLGEMFVDETGLRTVQFYGPAYSPMLFSELLRLIEPLPRPRAIVASMPIRSTHLHVAEHPVFGYEHARHALGRARNASSLGGRLLRPEPTTADYDRFFAMVRTSRWSGERSVGEFRRELRGIDAMAAPDDRLRLMWDYFHGEFSEDAPGLEGWARLGRQARRLGVPLIAYRAHMPQDFGTALLGREFVEHVEHNYSVVEQAVRSEVGDGGLFVDVPPLPDDHFIEPKDGTEHWNQAGRRAMVQIVKGAVADVLA